MSQPTSTALPTEAATPVPLVGHPEASVHTEASAPAHAKTASYEMPEEIPNVATLIETWVGKEEGHAAPEAKIGLSTVAEALVNPIYSILYCAVLVWVIRRTLKRVSLTAPGRLQMAVETVMGGLYNFFLGIMGPIGRPYIPYVCTLWLFILMNNLAVLIPGLKSPDSSLSTTGALGLCTFFYVNYQGIKASGIKRYCLHLLGSPTDIITWCLSPLFLFLEVIGTFIKPISLSLRLFGNIFGEDKLLASFLGMGMMIVAAIMGTAHPPIGLPLHLPFFFLVLLLSTIQATVFSMLTSIYILLLLPHGEHEHHEEPAAHEPAQAAGVVEAH